MEKTKGKGNLHEEKIVYRCYLGSVVSLLPAFEYGRRAVRYGEGALRGGGYYHLCAASVSAVSVQEERKHIKAVQVISAGSLIAFVVLFVLNLASVKMSASAGFVLDLLFKIFCAPIVCGQFWVVGLFLWASLLRVSVLMLKKLDQNRPDQK